MPEFLHTIPRELLEKYFGNDPRLLAAFEEQSAAVEAALDTTTGSIQATNSLQNATVLTLSANAVFNNEFIVTDGDGTALDISEGSVSIRVDSTVARTNGQNVKFNAPSGVTLGLPVNGTLVSDVAPATLFNKTLDNTTKFQNLIDAPTVAEAAAAGVPLWGVYRDGKDLHIRTV